MYSIYDQIFAFAVTICIGILGGMLFDIYRVFRGLWKPKKIGTFIGDLIFWLLLTCMVFLLLLFGNWGEIRIYVFIGIGIGCWFYLKFFSPKFKIFLRKIFIAVGKALRFIWRVIIWPFKMAVRILLIPLGLVTSGISAIMGFSKKYAQKTLKSLSLLKTKFFNKQPKE
ncbi:MAG: spore cortex biosynthesis protein YabQ [Bacillota bacterium]